MTIPRQSHHPCNSSILTSFRPRPSRKPMLGTPTSNRQGIFCVRRGRGKASHVIGLMWHKHRHRHKVSASQNWADLKPHLPGPELGTSENRALITSRRRSRDHPVYSPDPPSESRPDRNIRPCRVSRQVVCSCMSCVVYFVWCVWCVFGDAPKLSFRV